MSGALLQFIIVIALGGFCFGCGCLTAFILTRTKFRNEMIKRGAARYDSETGKWEAHDAACAKLEPERVIKQNIVTAPSKLTRRPDCGEYCEAARNAAPEH